MGPCHLLVHVFDICLLLYFYFEEGYGIILICLHLIYQNEIVFKVNLRLFHCCYMVLHLIAYSCKSTFQTFKILTSEIETSRLHFSTSENAIHVQNAISDLEILFFNLEVDFLNLQVWKLNL